MDWSPVDWKDFLLKEAPTNEDYRGKHYSPVFKSGPTWEDPTVPAEMYEMDSFVFVRRCALLQDTLLCSMTLISCRTC